MNLYSVGWQLDNDINLLVKIFIKVYENIYDLIKGIEYFCRKFFLEEKEELCLRLRILLNREIKGIFCNQ